MTNWSATRINCQTKIAFERQITYTHQHGESRSTRVGQQAHKEKPNAIVSGQLVPGLVQAVPSCESRFSIYIQWVVSSQNIESTHMAFRY